MDWKKANFSIFSHYRVSRRGSNGWTCLELTKWGTLNLPNFTHNSTSIPYLMQSERFKKALFHGLFDSTNKTTLRYSSNDFGIQSVAKSWLSNTTNSSSNTSSTTTTTRIYSTTTTQAPTATSTTSTSIPLTTTTTTSGYVKNKNRISYLPHCNGTVITANNLIDIDGIVSIPAVQSSMSVRGATKVWQLALR